MDLVKHFAKHVLQYFFKIWVAHYCKTIAILLRNSAILFVYCSIEYCNSAILWQYCYCFVQQSKKLLGVSLNLAKKIYISQLRHDKSIGSMILVSFLLSNIDFVFFAFSVYVMCLSTKKIIILHCVSQGRRSVHLLKKLDIGGSYSRNNLYMKRNSHSNDLF